MYYIHLKIHEKNVNIHLKMKNTGDNVIYGFWILDFGFWILDFGFWILDFGFWIFMLNINIMIEM